MQVWLGRMHNFSDSKNGIYNIFEFCLNFKILTYVNSEKLD